MTRDEVGQVDAAKGSCVLVAQGVRAGDALLVQGARALDVAELDRDARGVVAGRGDRARVTELAMEQQAGVVERGSRRIVPAKARQDAGPGQCVRPPRRHLAAGSGQRSIQPRASLRQVAADLPEPPQARGEAQLRARSVRILVRPGQCGAKVVVIVRQAREPLRLLSTREEPGPRLLDDGEIPVAVAGVDRRCLGGLGQALLRVVADRLEHAIARLARRRFGQEQRLVDEPLEEVEHLVGDDGAAGRHRLGRLEGERPREHREPGEQRALGVGQQVEAPVHGGAKRPMTRQCRAAAPGQQAEAMVEPGGDLGRRQGANPGRRELDRQRDAVETVADLHDRLCVLGSSPKPGSIARPRSRKRRTASEAESCCELVRRQRADQCRQRHRGNGHEALTAHAERLPAGGDDAEVGAAAQERVGYLHDGVEDVLAVVEDHERRPVGDSRHDGRDRAVHGWREPQGRGDRIGHERLVVERRELDEPDAAGILVDQVRAHLQGEAGLAHASRAGQGQQRGGGQALLHVGELLASADEARELVGQVVRERLERPDRRKFVGKAGREHLVEPDRSGEVLEPMVAELAEADRLGKCRPDEGARRIGEEDLPAMTGGADARGAVDVDADVARHGAHRLTAVQAHADPDLDAAGPGMCRERSLGVDARQQPGARRRERDEQAIAGRIDSRPAVRGQDAVEDPVVVAQQRCVGVAQLLEQPRRSSRCR